MSAQMISKTDFAHLTDEEKMMILMEWANLQKRIDVIWIEEVKENGEERKEDTHKP